MKLASESAKDMQETERNLLSVAYKNVVGSKRSSWRVISSIEQKCGVDETEKLQETQQYRKKIEEELNNTCKEVLVC